LLYLRIRHEAMHLLSSKRTKIFEICPIDARFPSRAFPGCI
jgi:hypothetical protein